MNDAREKLSTLWIVVMFNMLYADILGFLNPEFLRELMTGYAEGIRVTQPLLVGSAVMVEIPILMVLLSRILKPTANRWANVVAVTLTTAFIIGGGSTSPHYLLLATMELVCLALVLRHAWRWRVETPLATSVDDSANAFDASGDLGRTADPVSPNRCPSNTA